MGGRFWRLIAGGSGENATIWCILLGNKKWSGWKRKGYLLSTSFLTSRLYKRGQKGEAWLLTRVSSQLQGVKDFADGYEA